MSVLFVTLHLFVDFGKVWHSPCWLCSKCIFTKPKGNLQIYDSKYYFRLLTVAVRSLCRTLKKLVGHVKTFGLLFVYFQWQWWRLYESFKSTKVISTLPKESLNELTWQNLARKDLRAARARGFWKEDIFGAR